MDPEIVAALIGPVITAALAGGAVGLKEWRTRRANADQRQATLDQAAAEVAFIDAWTTTHAKLASPEEHRDRSVRALADLERSYLVMAAAHQAAANTPRLRSSTERLASLLLFRLRRPWAKFWRVLYYLFLLLGLFFVVAGMQGVAAGEKELVVTIIAGMVFTALSFLPAIGCYFAARLADRPKRDPHLAPPPFDPSLGGYPPASWGGYPPVGPPIRPGTAPGPGSPYAYPGPELGRQ